MCEDVLLAKRRPGFTTFILRPATVCGYSPRLRLDLTVNISHESRAVTNRVIKVFGGTQQRPNLHIQDMCAFYLQSLLWPSEKIDGKIYNVGYQKNLQAARNRDMVKSVVGEDCQIVTTPTDDNRSYRVCSEKLKRELGFEPKHTVLDAIQDLIAAFRAGKIPNSMTDIGYYNLKVLQGPEAAELQRPQPASTVTQLRKSA